MVMHHPISRHHASDLAFPDEKRPLAGRAVLPISRGIDHACTLFWDDLPQTTAQAWLRIVVAVDHRQPHQVAVSHPVTGDQLGVMDVLYSGAGQVFELPLTNAQVEVAVRDGLSLSLVNDADPLWMVGCDAGSSMVVMPHILFASPASADVDQFLSLFCSTATLQPCDWMEACVLDGLCDWARLGHAPATHALSDHLDIYFLPDGEFRREDIFGKPADNVACSEENHGPFAALAIERPDHPALRLARRAFDDQCHPNVDAVSGGCQVAETSYSVAHVMAAIAMHAGDEELLPRAVHQLRVNREMLVTDDALWLRHRHDTGECMFDSWSRGVAWYFLGLVRTLAIMDTCDRPADLLAEAERMAAWVTQHRQPDGLWSVFLKEEDLLPDTSGSAGIAAALAIAVKHQIIEAKHTDVAQSACKTLMTYLTPDGWLRGVAQSNKRETHAMDIQRARYRVIGPWGMGLLAQALAALTD